MSTGHASNSLSSGDSILCLSKGHNETPVLKKCPIKFNVMGSAKASACLKLVSSSPSKRSVSVPQPVNCQHVNASSTAKKIPFKRDKQKVSMESSTHSQLLQCQPDALAHLAVYMIHETWRTVKTMDDTHIPTSDNERSSLIQMARRIEGVLRHSKVSVPCLLTALLFVRRLRECVPVGKKIAKGAELQLFGIALMLSQKYHDDNRFSNRSWAGILKVDLGDLNILEMEFLTSIRWNVHVPLQEYWLWTCTMFNMLNESVLFFKQVYSPCSSSSPVSPTAQSDKSFSFSPITAWKKQLLRMKQAHQSIMSSSNGFKSNSSYSPRPASLNNVLSRIDPVRIPAGDSSWIA